MSNKDEVPVMILNRACKNFFLCSNYEIETSDEFRRAGLNKIHFFIGCPSLRNKFMNLFIVFFLLFLIAFISFVVVSITSFDNNLPIIIGIIAVLLFISMIISGIFISPKDEYADLIEDYYKARSNLEKFYVNHPEFRDLTIN